MDVTKNDLFKIIQGTEYRPKNVNTSFLKPHPPRNIESKEAFNAILLQAAAAAAAATTTKATASTYQPSIVVVDFFATWCGPCKQIAPAYRSLAMTTPIATFLSVDIDENEKLASSLKITSMPTFKMFRGEECIFTVVGGGPEAIQILKSTIDKHLTEPEQQLFQRWKKIHIDGAFDAKEYMATVNVLKTEGWNMNALATRPLAVYQTDINAKNGQSVLRTSASGEPVLLWEGMLTSKSRVDLGLSEMNGVLPFDLSNHPHASSSVVAKSMLERMSTDIKWWADKANGMKVPKIVHLLDDQLKTNVFLNPADISKTARQQEGQPLPARLHGLKLVLARLRRLTADLKQLRDSDVAYVAHCVPLLLHAANYVELKKEKQESKRQEKVHFLLRRQAGQEASIWLEYLFGCLLSSKALLDLKTLNPYLNNDVAVCLLKVVAATLLRSNRIGQANRCISASVQLMQSIQEALSCSDEQRWNRRNTYLPKIMQHAESVAGQLTSARHFVTDTKLPALPGGVEEQVLRSFDPRFLVFEFTWNILLRKKQVTIVNNLIANLHVNTSKVKQMIMGAGKTTVVAPLLALMLADGQSLVLSVVPTALVEMSRTRMRETFATIMCKRVYTLNFDRSTTITKGLVDTLTNAKMNRGIVVATSTAVKSMMLSYVELHSQLREAQVKNIQGETQRSAMATTKELQQQLYLTKQVLRLFRDGVMLLDEVDMLLHPLKSELNFPTGSKYDLDGSNGGERWTLPMHLLDALFYTQTQVCTTFESTKESRAVLQNITNVVDRGFVKRALQRLPHVTLLDKTYYSTDLRPALAEWCYLWLQKQHLHGITKEECVRYLINGAAAKSQAKKRCLVVEAEIIKLQVDMGLVSNTVNMSVSALRQKSNDAMEEKKKQWRQSSSDGEKEKRKLYLKYLLQAKEMALVQSSTIEGIYLYEEDNEKRSVHDVHVFNTLNENIARIESLIQSIEYPRDESMDNNIVVLMCASFDTSSNSSSGGSSSSSSSSKDTLIERVARELERLGMTIRRCATPEEAVEKARELLLAGQLRCVVSNMGSEVAPSCPTQGCEMCIGTGGYEYFSCNGCRTSISGERWHCSQHSTDLCFVCAPVGGASRKKGNNDSDVDPHLECLQQLNDAQSDFALIQQQQARQKVATRSPRSSSVWTGHGGIVPITRCAMLDTTYRLTEPERYTCWQDQIMVLSTVEGNCFFYF